MLIAVVAHLKILNSKFMILLKKSRGFTLVELSMSILVIGLLVGGVLAGNGLVRQAKFKKLLGQVTEAKEAGKVFTSRYNALPGDIKNAFALFGGAVCAGDADSCNGNGDGRIGYNDYNDETYMAWKHLGLSSIYSGQFTGSAGEVLGKNIPASTFKTAGMRWRYNVIAAYDNLILGNSLMLTARAESLNEGGMSPKDARAFDEKYDDSIPATGNIISFIGTATNDDTACFTGTYAAGDTAYIVSSEIAGCLMVFPAEL